MRNHLCEKMVFILKRQLGSSRSTTHTHDMNMGNIVGSCHLPQRRHWSGNQIAAVETLWFWLVPVPVSCHNMGASVRECTTFSLRHACFSKDWNFWLLPLKGTSLWYVSMLSIVSYWGLPSGDKWLVWYQSLRHDEKPITWWWNTTRLDSVFCQSLPIRHEELVGVKII